MACEFEYDAYNAALASYQQALVYCRRVADKAKRNAGETRKCLDLKHDAMIAIREAEEKLQACLLSAPAQRVQSEGLVTFLLVVEPGVGYGGGDTNWIDADVIFKLDSRPDKAFGFRVREDDFGLLHHGMLSVLEQAIVHGLRVTTSYTEVLVPLNQNSFVVRVALSKPKPVLPGDNLDVRG
jgi:hypothetical protein